MTHKLDSMQACYVNTTHPDFIGGHKASPGLPSSNFRHFLNCPITYRLLLLSPNVWMPTSLSRRWVIPKIQRRRSTTTKISMSIRRKMNPASLVHFSLPKLVWRKRELLLWTPHHRLFDRRTLWTRERRWKQKSSVALFLFILISSVQNISLRNVSLNRTTHPFLFQHRQAGDDWYGS